MINNGAKIMSEQEPKKEYVDFLDFTKGLYEKALEFLAPGSDDFSIFSGAILLTVGLEKFVKYVLYTRHPFMILFNKIDVMKDILELEKGGRFANRNTISFELALKRLFELYPKLKSELQDTKYIIDNRNFLVHNFGYIEVGRLEKKIQTKVADMTEKICLECLQKNPQEIFTEKVWNQLSETREAYKDANILGLEERVKHLKRLYSKGETLPCEQLELPRNLSYIYFNCPICEDEEAIIGIDWDINVDSDHGESFITGYPYPVLIKCDCGFTIKDVEEIDILLGDNYETLIEKYEAENQPQQEYCRDDE